MALPRVEFDAFAKEGYPETAKAFMAAWKAIRELQPKDTGWKGGFKTTSYEHRLNGVVARSWHGDCEQAYSIDLISDDNTVQYVGSVYVADYGPSHYTLDKELFEKVVKLVNMYTL